MDITAFVESYLSLLANECAADIAQQSSLISNLHPTDLARAGLAITNLLPAGQRTGFGGRTVVELVPDTAVNVSGLLTINGVRVGDDVRVGVQPSGSATKWEKREAEVKGVEGVVSRISDRGVFVAINGDGNGGVVDGIWTSGKRVWVVKIAKDVTYKRMEKAMRVLKEIGNGERQGTGLVDVLFGKRRPMGLPRGYDTVPMKWFDKKLNEGQKEAVRFALASEVALIHGPPGTGKTQTLLEIILHLATPRPSSDPMSPTPPPKKILVCGPSNISVDNIVLRLPTTLPLIRLGHPARLLPKVVERSLDTLTRASEQGEIVADVRKEMDDLLAKLNGDGKAKLKGRAMKEGWERVRELRGEYKQRERKCVAQIVNGSKVVLATLHGGGGKQLHTEKFDVVIIDESCQALEAQCWIPLLLANGKSTGTITKLILAGDPHQLAPTIKSQRNSSKPSTATGISLDITLFSRILALHGQSIKRTLTTQYRMHESIMAFPSLALYDNLLVASPSVASRLLSTSLPYPVTATEDTSTPLLFIDTQGGSFPEDPQFDTPSKSNTPEARIVSEHVHSLIISGVLPSDIAVVTPYSAQVALISKYLRLTYPDVEVNSVDSFQGREKEVVVLSLVRSNDKGEVGFLADERRMNVAITRARCHLCVVGDGETISRGGRKGGKNWKGFLPWWIEWLESEESGCEVRYPDLVEVLRGWVGGVDIGEEDE